MFQFQWGIDRCEPCWRERAKDLLQAKTGELNSLIVGTVALSLSERPACEIYASF